MKKAVKTTAMFDAGYSGYLCLPVHMAADLGLVLLKTASYELADGRIIEDEPVYAGQLLWNRKWHDIEIDSTKSPQALLGVSIPAIFSARINIDYNTGDFTIEV